MFPLIMIFCCINILRNDWAVKSSRLLNLKDLTPFLKILQSECENTTNMCLNLNIRQSCTIKQQQSEVNI